MQSPNESQDKIAPQFDSKITHSPDANVHKQNDLFISFDLGVSSLTPKTAGCVSSGRNACYLSTFYRLLLFARSLSLSRSRSICFFFV